MIQGGGGEFRPVVAKSLIISNPYWKHLKVKISHYSYNYYGKEKHKFCYHHHSLYAKKNAHYTGIMLDASTIALCPKLSSIYTAENFWCGSDESGTRTQKIVLITHLHVLFSTVLKDVKL